MTPANIAVLEAELAELQGQLDTELGKLASAVDPQIEQMESLTVSPKKADIAVRVMALGWLPWARDDRGGLARAF